MSATTDLRKNPHKIKRRPFNAKVGVPRETRESKKSTLLNRRSTDRSELFEDRVPARERNEMPYEDVECAVVVMNPPRRTEGGIAYLCSQPISAMNKKQRAMYEARARIIKAMAHPTRLFIVDELSKCERCVRELTEMTDVDVSTVSKHLSILRNAGIVSDEKRGAQVYYTLRVPCVMGFFSCVESVLKTTASDQLKLTS